MAELECSKESDTLESSLNDSGNQSLCQILSDDESEDHDEDVRHPIVTKLRAIANQVENEVQQQMRRAAKNDITKSALFEKDETVEFTKNFLSIWGFDEHLDLIMKNNVDKQSFLRLTDNSEVFDEIKNKNIIDKILRKKKTLSEYLVEPKYKMVAANGKTLKRHLQEDPEKRIWLEEEDCMQIASELCYFIIDNVMKTKEKQTTMKPNDFRFWANEICLTWPKKNDPWIWYKPYIFNGNNKKCQGKLYEVYKTLTTKHRKVVKRIEMKKRGELEITEEQEDEKMFEKLQSLYQYKEINDNFLMIWKETEQYRRKKKISLAFLGANSEIFKNVENIRKLINVDFDSLANEKFAPNHLPNVWYENSRRVIYFKLPKSEIIESIREQVKSSANDAETRRNFAWQILPYCMTPPANCNNEKKRFKASKSEGSISFIRWINKANLLGVTMNQHCEELEELKVPIRPYVIAVKPDEKVTNAYAIIKNNFYECETLTSAVELAFKFYVVDRQEYCKLSRCMWSFIERYLFKIDVSKYQELSTVSVFIQKLQEN